MVGRLGAYLIDLGFCWRLLIAMGDPGILQLALVRI